MYKKVTFFCSVHVRLLHCKMRDMFCCGKLCTLVLSLCDFTFYSCKGDDDIKIQWRHIKQGNNELKSGWYRSHRAVQHRVSPKCGTYKHKMEWQKTHRCGDWFDIWLCVRNRRCHFDFCQC